MLDLLIEVSLVAIEAQPECDVVVDAHRERIGLLKNHPDIAPDDYGIDAGVIDVLTEKVDVTFEPKPRNHIVHAVEAAQNGALAASRGSDKTGDRPLLDRYVAVAYREKIPIKDFADVAFDRDF